MAIAGSRTTRRWDPRVFLRFQRALNVPIATCDTEDKCTRIVRWRFPWPAVAERRPRASWGWSWKRKALAIQIPFDSALMTTRGRARVARKAHMGSAMTAGGEGAFMGSMVSFTAHNRRNCIQYTVYNFEPWRGQGPGNTVSSSNLTHYASSSTLPVTGNSEFVLAGRRIAGAAGPGMNRPVLYAG